MSILHRRKKVKRRQLERMRERGELTPREQEELDSGELEIEDDDATEELMPPTREQLEAQRDTKRRELEEIELQLTAPTHDGNG